MRLINLVPGLKERVSFLLRFGGNRAVVASVCKERGYFFLIPIETLSSAKETAVLKPLIPQTHEKHVP